MTKRLSLLALAMSALISCRADIAEPGGTDPGTPPGTPPGGPPGMTPPPPPGYEPLPPRAYASKVKDLLTGLPLTDSELTAVTADPKALRGLIDSWMALPSFRDKMLEFFKKSFQQTQLDPTDLDDMLALNTAQASAVEQRRMLRSVEESFSRTVLALIDEKRPFTEAVTTTRFMLNVPMMVALSYMDAAPQDDVGRPLAAGYWHLQKFGGAMNFKFIQVLNLDPVTGLQIPIPFEETIDPASPNFMHWTFTQVDPLRYPTPCADTITVMGANAVQAVFRALFGSRRACNGAPVAPTQFTDADWNTWRMIEIRAPKAGEERTTFWELPKLRDPATTSLILTTPRVGFFTTLAFFANWPTNPSNSYRVTTNQALIVALGRSFDDRNTTVQVSETSVDALHVMPGTVCFACHQTLDPMRDFFKQSYSLTYFQQLSTLNPKNPPLPPEGVFTVDGSAPVRGAGVAALARAMVEHPRFPIAWTQKLCQLANATPCLEDDPELQRVAGVFKQSKFDFKALVRELFSSPLVTYTAPTKTADSGVIMSIARRDTYCDRLGTRLNVKDLCNQQGESNLPKIAGQARNLSLGIPGSGYSRADENPVTPHDSNLFFSSATEKICMAVAGQLVDAMLGSYKSANADPAIAEFVRSLMGVPANDPMYPRLIDILTRHFLAAKNAKETPADALRSTFTVACSSPLAVSSGL
jgi:hypothetical protein